MKSVPVLIRMPTYMQKRLKLIKSKTGAQYWRIIEGWYNKSLRRKK